MKKMVALVIIWIFILGAGLIKNAAVLPIDKYLYRASYSFYLKHKNDININDIGGRIINGTTLIVSGMSANITKVKINNNQILGESASLKGSKSEFYEIARLIGGDIIKIENIGDKIISIYGFSKYLNKEIVIGDKLVNFQIAYNDGIITLGTPIILGEY